MEGNEEDAAEVENRGQNFKAKLKFTTKGASITKQAGKNSIFLFSTAGISFRGSIAPRTISSQSCPLLRNPSNLRSLGPSSLRAKRPFIKMWHDIGEKEGALAAEVVVSGGLNVVERERGRCSSR